MKSIKQDLMIGLPSALLLIFSIKSFFFNPSPLTFSDAAVFLVLSSLVAFCFFFIDKQTSNALEAEIQKLKEKQAEQSKLHTELVNHINGLKLAQNIRTQQSLMQSR